MKINKTIFWIFSIIFSLLSCYLFEKSSIKIYSDSTYMQSLQLLSDSDTPTIPIAGSVILSYAAMLGHIILLLSFLIIAYTKDKDILINWTDFLFNFNKHKKGRAIILVFGYGLTIYWIWDFFDTTRIKLFGILLLFSIVAIIVTWTYVLWIINLTRRKPLQL